MANKRGQLILQALQDIGKAANIAKIMAYVAEGLEPKDVKKTIQQTLEGGVRYGFLQCKNQKYFPAPVALEASSDEKSKIDLDNENLAYSMGQLIMYAMDHVVKPATVPNIIVYIADAAGVEGRVIKKVIQETLEGGVLHGFIQCKNQKYFQAAVVQEASIWKWKQDMEIKNRADGRRSRSSGFYFYL